MSARAEFHRSALSLPDDLPLNKTGAERYWEKLLALPPERILPLIESSPAQSRQAQIDLFQQFVAIICVETSSYCNRNCAYCPDALPEYGRKRKDFIAAAAWQRLLDNLQEISYRSTVSLNLYNEVLADPSLLDKIRQVRTAAPEAFIKFNSNGDFLNREKLEQLEQAGLDAIFVSLHPARNMPYEDADRISSVHKLFQRIGYAGEIDSIVPQRSIRTDLRFGNMRVLVMCDNWNRYGTDRSGIIQKLAVRERNPPCLRPQREFIIANDGFVYPCCQTFPDEPANHRYRLGNIEHEDIFAIYAKQIAAGWRRALFGFSAKDSPCTSCSDPDNATPESASLREQLLATRR